MNHVHAIEREVFQRRAHRARDSGGAGPLHFKAAQPAADMHDQIHFGAGVRCPEEALPTVHAKGVHEVFDHEALP